MSSSYHTDDHRTWPKTNPFRPAVANDATKSKSNEDYGVSPSITTQGYEQMPISSLSEKHPRSSESSVYYNDSIDPNFYSNFAGASMTDPAGNMSSRGTSASGSASGISGTSWATREGTLLQGGGVELSPIYSNLSNNTSFTESPRDATMSNCLKPYDIYSEGDSSATPPPNAPASYSTRTRTRETPSTLGWLPDCEWIKLYTFIIKKGEDPYLQLQTGYAETEVTPKIVYLDPPPKNLPKGSYSCRFPACQTRKPFNRPADLDRHYRNFHASDGSKEQFYCDYPRCHRSQLAFSRKDHYRDHLRDYHKEDIAQPRRTKKDDDVKWEKMQKQWQQERATRSKQWWRCSKCLNRIQVHKEGWECRRCNLACESDRKAARSKIEAEDEYGFAYDTTPTFAPPCYTCEGTGLIENLLKGWNLCPDCSLTRSSEDLGGSYNYSTY